MVESPGMENTGGSGLCEAGGVVGGSGARRGLGELGVQLQSHLEWQHQITVFTESLPCPKVLPRTGGATPSQHQGKDISLSLSLFSKTGSHVAQDGLKLTSRFELLVFLSLPAECWALQVLTLNFYLFRTGWPTTNTQPTGRQE